MNGKEHIAELALPPLVNVAQGRTIIDVLRMEVLWMVDVVVAECVELIAVLVSHVVPINTHSKW